MWTTRAKILFSLYWTTAAWLPISQRMPLARKVRTWWAKKIVAHCGENVNIERRAVFSPGLSIGNNSGVGIDCEIYGPVVIGDDVMMGPEVIVYTGMHRHNRVDIPMRLQGSEEVRKVVIGNDVWIGRRVIIMPGVVIGDGCVIGAGAIVTRSIPPYCIAAGVPAQIISKRTAL